MDNRRFNTTQLLTLGILDLPTPKQEVPSKAKLQHVDEDDIQEDTLRKGLLIGGLSASMYYGCWSIWGTDNGYSGELLQYRSVTDKFKNESLKIALEKALEWAQGCRG